MTFANDPDNPKNVSTNPNSSLSKVMTNGLGWRDSRNSRIEAIAAGANTDRGQLDFALNTKSSIDKLDVRQGEDTLQNPLFLYPNQYTRVAATGDRIKVNRGYIRRLTEFYASTAQSTIKNTTIKNMRCNFQFNPDVVTRGVSANTDMQFLFNQDPAQLAQPIPGNATFAFELLFNREAELASGTWRSRNADISTKDPGLVSNGLAGSASRLNSNPEMFVSKSAEYEQSWVTEIGVLADIIMLDGVIGQGLSKDLISSLTAAVSSTPKTDNTEDETDTEEDTTATYDAGRLTSFSMNIGNTAFLVPQPVRILFSEWLMIEGFVMESQVTFNKFTTNYIPSQASVYITMQALYIGFAQENSFLTGLKGVPVADPQAPNGPDDAHGSSALAVKKYNETVTGIATLLDSRYLVNGTYSQSPQPHPSPGAYAINRRLSYFFALLDGKISLDFFDMLMTKEGASFYESCEKDVGSGFGISFSGTIKIWWNKHVTNVGGGTQTRHYSGRSVFTGAAAPLTYTPGKPSDQDGLSFSVYGSSKDNPMLFAITNAVGNVGKATDKYRTVNFGTGKYGSSRSEWESTTTLSAQYPRPYAEDLFNVDVDITFQVSRFVGDAALELHETLPQHVVKSWTGIRADEAILFKDLSIKVVL